MGGSFRKVGAFSFALRIGGNWKTDRTDKRFVWGRYEIKARSRSANPIDVRSAYTEPNYVLPDQMHYGPVPGFLPAGAQLAVLEGDPTASSGDFAVRLVQSFVTSLAVGEHARQLKISC